MKNTFLYISKKIMHKKTTLALFACVACMIFITPQSFSMVPADQSSSEPAISQQELAEIQADIRTTLEEINSPQFKQDLAEMHKEAQRFADDPSLLDGPLQKFNKTILAKTPPLITFEMLEGKNSNNTNSNNGSKNEPQIESYKSVYEYDTDQHKFVDNYYHYDAEKKLYIRHDWSKSSAKNRWRGVSYVYDPESMESRPEEEYNARAEQNKPKTPETPKEPDNSKKHAEPEKAEPSEKKSTEKEPEKKGDSKEDGRFESPLKDGFYAFGLYGKDVTTLLFIAMDFIVDRMFYTQLKKDYSELFAKNLIEKKATVMPLLMAIQNNPKDTKENIKKAEKALTDFITKECFPSFAYARDLTLRKFMRMFRYMATCEGARLAKDWALDASNAPKIFSNPIGWGKQYVKNIQVIPTSAVISSILFLIFGYNGSPLEPDASVIRQSLLKISQMYLLGASPTGKSSFAEALDTYSKCTGSYFFEGFKKLLINTRFTKQSHNYYQKLTTEYMVNTAKELTLILRDIPSYEQRAKMIENVNDEKIIENEQKLKNHFTLDPNNSFLSWWKFKNSCYRWTSIWIEAVMLIPVWIVAGTWLYKKYVKKETQPLSQPTPTVV